MDPRFCCSIWRNRPAQTLREWAANPTRYRALSIWRAERLEEAAKPAHLERSAGTIKLVNRGTHAKVLITLDDAAVATPDLSRYLK